MSVPWIEIAARYRALADPRDGAFGAAVAEIGRLAALIAQGPLDAILFGWCSMNDLCVQQTDTPPFSGPYLRIAPLASGEIEFRYIDTHIVSRQWQRAVPAKAAPARLAGFLDQLGWVAGGAATGLAVR